MTSGIPPADLGFFSVLAGAGSLSAAARELGITTPAVSKRLAMMESRLGLSLVSRTTRRMGLTPEGHLLGHERHQRFLGRNPLLLPHVDGSFGAVRMDVPGLTVLDVALDRMRFTRAEEAQWRGHDRYTGQVDSRAGRRPVMSRASSGARPAGAERDWVR